MTAQPQTTRTIEKQSILSTLHRRMAYACLLATASWGAVDALAKPIRCTDKAYVVTAVAEPLSQQITAAFQVPNTPMQVVLKTDIETSDTTCLVVHLSGLTRITDNYVVFQVSVDGVPMDAGQYLTGLASPDTPVTAVSIDALSAAPYNDEQFIDPTKTFAFNFFTVVKAGVHTVTVSTAAGSGVIPGNYSTVHNLVLTMSYR